MLVNELNRNALGGTELMAKRLYATVNADLLDRFQIWFSRFRPEQFNPGKLQIFYAHDLVEDPEAQVLANGGWGRFHKIVFVSNWQMQRFCAAYQIPFARCEVMLNAITPIEVPKQKSFDKIRIGYWSTPHRGLEILVPVFEFLAEKYENIELDVFSSFQIYGWEERDAPYRELFDRCKAHKQINYHGSVAYNRIREFAADAHILAYPCIWPETSCLVLMEAMSAQMMCVHPNYGALYETGANWTAMYQYDEDPSGHAKKFHQTLESAILAYDHPTVRSRLVSQKAYADVFYNWGVRAAEWEFLLQAIIDSPDPIITPQSMFQVNTG